MTLGPNVAADAQRLAPEATHDAPQAAPAQVVSAGRREFPCRFGKGNCPALANLFDGKAVPGPEGELSWAAEVAPCASCKKCYLGGRQQLRGVRLGQREREILVNAADTEVFTLTERGMSRSLSAARRRAAQTLTKAGLVESAAKHAHSRAAVRLTPLGRYIMAAYGRFIRTGKPIRWDRPLARIPVPGREPEELLEQTIEQANLAMRKTLKELMSVLFAAVKRPVKDAAALDEITRRLEMKAEGLRALLGSRAPNAVPRAAPAA